MCHNNMCMYLDAWNNMHKMDWTNVSHFILGKGKFVLIFILFYFKDAKISQCYSKNGHITAF